MPACTPAVSQLPGFTCSHACCVPVPPHGSLFYTPVPPHGNGHQLIHMPTMSQSTGTPACTCVVSSDMSSPVCTHTMLQWWHGHACSHIPGLSCSGMAHMFVHLVSSRTEIGCLDKACSPTWCVPVPKHGGLGLTVYYVQDHSRGCTLHLLKPVMSQHRHGAVRAHLSCLNIARGWHGHTLMPAMSLCHRVTTQAHLFACCCILCQTLAWYTCSWTCCIPVSPHCGTEHLLCPSAATCWCRPTCSNTSPV